VWCSWKARTAEKEVKRRSQAKHAFPLLKDRNQKTENYRIPTPGPGEDRFFPNGKRGRAGFLFDVQFRGLTQKNGKN